VAQRHAPFRVFDAFLDEGTHAEPRLHANRVTGEVGQDEAVGVGDFGFFEQAELVRVDLCVRARAMSPGAWGRGSFVPEPRSAASTTPASATPLGRDGRPVGPGG